MSCSGSRQCVCHWLDPVVINLHIYYGAEIGVN